ncbi:Calcium-binding protein 8 [Labeo rohita]|uniref:Calcium-binding protein 8 n=1 Tax=Labeo rohita TaxID=84645 RepID=A0ABQ8LKZ0_LABRO|nr:Calcium-binding protein 8 [Labeo rohita]
MACHSSLQGRGYGQLQARTPSSSPGLSVKTQAAYGLDLPLRTVDVSGPCPTNRKEETELSARSRLEDSLVTPDDFDPWRGSFAAIEVSEVFCADGEPALVKMPFHHVRAGLLYTDNYLSTSLSETSEEQLANISTEELGEIREAFRVLDRDGNGFISKQELGMAMRSLGYMPSEVELAIIMQRLDMDGDGQVDFDEFMTILGPKLVSSETREGFLGSTIDSIFWQHEDKITGHTLPSPPASSIP